MLGSMNAITENIECNCRMLPAYESINLDEIEDNYIDWPSFDAVLRKYRSTRDYWVEKGMVLL